MRTVRTASGAMAVQIVWSSHRGSRRIEHIGSGHDPGEVEALKAAAQQRISAGQGELDLGLGGAPATGGPLPIRSTRMAALGDALAGVYAGLGFEEATHGDEVFRALVLARIIEPTSKLDALRVLAEAGLSVPSYRTLQRRLPHYSTEAFRAGLAAACARHAALGPAALVLYDVSTLYFEIDREDDYRKPGFSKERRLEPQITIGLLTDAAGMPLMVNGFEGNKAETQTMIPVLTAFQKAHGIAGVTVVADAGMLSAANLLELEKAGLSFIVGARIPTEPYVVTQWRTAHPGQDPTDGQVLTQNWPAGQTDHRKDQKHHYQYRADRARRTLRGIDEQVAKAEKAVAGTTPVKRNRFVRLSGGDRSVNRELEAKARSLAGWKGYVTNLVDEPADSVIGAYHQLWRIEKAFRMSKHDLQARPIYHHKRESIDAHLAVVFAALAVTHRIQTATGWSISKFVKTARRYRIIEIQAGHHTLTAADPIPDDLHTALNARKGAH